MTIELHALLEVFYDEAAEHLVDLQTVLWSLSPIAPDPDALEVMVRSARSAKVSSITLGLADVTELVHQFERLLGRVQRGQVAVTPQVRDTGLQACVVLRALLAAHRGNGSVETAQAEDACSRLQALGDGSDMGASPGRRPLRPDETGDAAVLPVGWREQSRYAAVRAADALSPTDRFRTPNQFKSPNQFKNMAAPVREPAMRRQERTGRAGSTGRRKG